MTLLLKETLEQRTLRIADQLQPEIQRTFLAAVETAKRSIPIGELSDFFEVGDIQGALEAAGITLTAAELQPITEAILQTTLKTAELAAIDLNLEFALVNERAVRFATEEAARLVTSISSETEKAIRDIVIRGQREGLNARSQAQHIRRIVGNTDRDARAIDRFYVGLLDRETSTTNLARAGELADRMAARLLKRRAENIARTETIRAANMGNQLSWDAAMDNGLLPRTTRKVWIATADSRTCPICAVLHDQTISVSSTFDISERATSFERTGGGESLDFRVAEKVPLKNPTAERQPPAHPSCRCTTGLVFGEGENGETRQEGRLLDLDESQLPVMNDAYAIDEIERLIQEGNVPPESLKSYDKVRSIFGDNLFVEGERLNRPLVKHFNDIAAYPDRVLRKLADEGVSIHVGKGGLPDLDQFGNMKGRRPRGWPKGKTWDDVAGGYQHAQKRLVLGDRVHGAQSLAGHELGHAVDRLFGVRGHSMNWDSAVVAQHNRVFDQLEPYFQQGGGGRGTPGIKEFIAEALGNTATGVPTSGWYDAELRKFFQGILKG